MTGEEMREWLDHELQAFPERASGEELYEYLEVRARRAVEEDRAHFVEALQHWLRLRSEPRTMIAVKLAAELRLDELRSDIEGLLDDVGEGVAFNPALRSYYARRITDALSRI